MLATVVALCLSPSWALPIKPDIKVLLEEAKRPPVRFVPARAGWNGPEAKPAKTLNATYEQLRREASPGEVRKQFLAIAVPDWRLLLCLAFLILFLRWLRPSRLHARDNVLVFPHIPSVVEADVSQAA
jgi:hypothetical protein